VIVGLGDSMMFGQGVADGETYLDVLQGLLAAHEARVDWQVINTAVTGYNTVMEVATYETKCAQLRPALVLLGIYANDYDPPNYVREEDDVFDLRRCYLLELFESRLPRKGVPTPGLVHRGLWEDAHPGGERSAPRRYDHLHGPQAFRAALARLRELTAASGTRCIALATVDFMQVPEMMRTAAELGLETLHCQPEIEAHVVASTGRAFTWADYEHSDLVLNPQDVHPSKLQHELVGRRIFAQLLDSGWIAEQVARTRR